VVFFIPSRQILEQATIVTSKHFPINHSCIILLLDTTYFSYWQRRDVTHKEKRTDDLEPTNTAPDLFVVRNLTTLSVYIVYMTSDLRILISKNIWNEAVAA
jgi:hypothetical protein